jgi:hypothetical protein
LTPFPRGLNIRRNTPLWGSTLYSGALEELRMRWYHYIAYFFGGAFLVNAIPHFVSGVTGHPFQSPFATPPGEGLSPAWVNVLWGSTNFVFAYLLLLRVGNFDFRRWLHGPSRGRGWSSDGADALTHLWALLWWSMRSAIKQRLTIHSSGLVRRAAVQSCGARHRPLTSSVSFQSRRCRISE